MIKHCIIYSLIMLSLIHVTSPSASRGEGWSGAQGIPGYAVKADFLPKYHPRGASLPLRFSLQNTTDESLPLLMDHAGDPVNGLLRFNRASGEAYGQAAPILYSRLRPPQQGHPQTPIEAAYQVEPAQSLEFVIDLATLLDLEAAPAGEYMVSFETQTQTFTGGRFRLVDYDTLTAQEVRGVYRPMLRGPDAAVAGEATVRLSLASYGEGGDAVQWLLVDRIMALGREQSDLPRYAHPVPVGSRIERAEMDDQGQVWVLVQADDQHMLCIWRLEDLGWSVLVPATRQEVVFGTTRAYNGSTEGIVVIAGLKGETLHTTHSVAAQTTQAGGSETAANTADTAQTPATQPAATQPVGE